MPWDCRDRLIGVRSSAACANNSVGPARPPAPSGEVVGRRQAKPRIAMDGGRVRIVSACSIRCHQTIQSGVAGDCATALELFAHATQSRAATAVVAPITWCTSGIICASARVCECVSVQGRECARARVCKGASVQGRKCASAQVRKGHGADARRAGQPAPRPEGGGAQTSQACIWRAGAEHKVPARGAPTFPAARRSLKPFRAVIRPRPRPADVPSSPDGWTMPVRLRSAQRPRRWQSRRQLRAPGMAPGCRV